MIQRNIVGYLALNWAQNQQFPRRPANKLVDWSFGELENMSLELDSMAAPSSMPFYDHCLMAIVALDA